MLADENTAAAAATTIASQRLGTESMLRRSVVVDELNFNTLSFFLLFTSSSEARWITHVFLLARSLAYGFYTLIEKLILKVFFHFFLLHLSPALLLSLSRAWNDKFSV
jgi:hypothetical protein